MRSHQANTRTPRAARSRVASCQAATRAAPVSSRRAAEGSYEGLGNQAFQRLLAARALHAKLELSQPHEPEEQEAERVAERVARLPDTDALRGDRHARDVAPPPDDFVHTLGPGAPLAPATRAFFEPRFGADLGHVRVHSGSEADHAAREIEALAFSAGDHVAFRAGRYAPESLQGRRLLAHELTHTLQQRTHRGAHAPARVLRAPAPGSALVPPAGSGLSDEMLSQIAHQLRAAMRGLGTDEDAIYAAMAGRTRAQVDEIARVYQNAYGRSLLDDFKSELNDRELLHLALFSPAGLPADPALHGATLADAVAWRLHRAMDRIGTDEDAIYAALTGRTVDERRRIKEAYLKSTQRALEADLRSELSGAELTHALMLLNQGLLEPEDELYLAMAGLGTDEDTVFRVLKSLSGNAAALTRLEANYGSKYGDLVQDLRGDLSASEYARARSYILPTIFDADVEDCGGGPPARNTQAVREVHARAVALHKLALARSKNVADPAVQAAALSYFKITLPAKTRRDAYFWRYVQHALESLKQAEVGATYECEPKNSLFHGFCVGDNAAVTIFNIHICPGFWSAFTSLDERAGVFIHEWGHRYGAGVATILETYCHGSAYAAASTADLVTWPDAYMQFIWDLAIGSPAPCF
jgi:hypothetical protein